MPRAARRAHFRRLPAAALVLLVVALTAPAAGQAATIHSSGPLTQIIIGPDLDCQVRYAGDQAFQFYPPSSESGSCGTYVARGQSVFGPDEYVPVDQAGPTGSGTAADPFTITTRVCAGSTDECAAGSAPLVTSVVRYVAGQDFYRTDVRVTSRGAAETIGIYQYADCYLQESDFGYGFFDASTGGVYCSRTANNSPPARIEGFVPVDPGSSWNEDSFSEVRNRVTSGGGGPLPNTCECGVDQDNGMALGWTGIALPAGGTVQRSLLVAFSPTGVPSSPSAGPDRDGDTVADPRDNCVDIANTAQSDVDRDGIGDACDRSDASAGPRLGQTVVARVVSGEVFVRLPAGRRPRSSARAAQAPAGYVALRGAEVLPVGTIVHATRGRLALTSAASRIGGRTQTQRAEFYQGIFQIRQRRARRPTTDIALRSTDFVRRCGSRAGVRAAGASNGTGVIAAQARRRSRRVVSRLWGNGRGRFRTIGRNSAATVRGTVWLTEERCDGTLTRVRTGIVSVRDLRANRTVTLRAGRSYLARAVRATLRSRRP